MKPAAERERNRFESILAIPTHYMGRRYRSRNEARWAVFFEHLGIDFEYEPEGFVLQDGSLYLPDFFLPSIHFWAECKPSYLKQEEEFKCHLLASGTGFPCLWLIGQPDFKAYRAATWDQNAYTVTEYSLDIFEYRKAYVEGHLWSQPNYSIRPQESEFSARYKEAVYASRARKFDVF